MRKGGARGQLAEVEERWVSGNLNPAYSVLEHASPGAPREAYDPHDHARRKRDQSKRF